MKMNNKNKKQSGMMKVLAGIWFQMTTPLDFLTKQGYSKSQIKRLVKDGAIDKIYKTMTGNKRGTIREMDEIFNPGDIMVVGKRKVYDI